MSGQPWFVPMVPDAERPVRLFAFPQAGGGCATFGACAALLRADTALWSVNLPGRQARFTEPPRTRLGPLVADLADDLAGRLDRPYALFGYCSGALLAFLLARAVTAAGLPSPHALIVASHPAPQRSRPPRTLHRMPAEEFWAELVSYGGVAAALLAQPDYREIFEPALRGDYALLADFVYEPGPPLDVPIVTIAGDADRAIDPDDVRAWCEQSTAGHTHASVDGDHWLLETAPAGVAAAISQQLRGPGRIG